VQNDEALHTLASSEERLILPEEKKKGELGGKKKVTISVSKSPSPKFLKTSGRNYHLLSMRSLKLLMIDYMHCIPSVHRVIRSIILPSPPSDPKVVHTDIHCSSSTDLHSNDTSHPSLSSSNCVSRTRAFTPQSYTENTLSGILAH
jgi:hypothetical protein